MPNIFVNPEHIKEGQITLTGEDYNHIVRVLRMKTGDDLNVLDNHGHQYRTQIISADKNSAVCLIEEVIIVPPSPFKIILAQAIIKGEKMDWLIQKATELGVSTIVPLITERTVVKLSAKDTPHKLERWQKIVKNAAEQCERPDLPVIEAPTTIQNLIIPEGTTAFVGMARGDAPMLRVYLSPLTKQSGSEDSPGCPESSIRGVRSLLFAAGPEGGFTPDEKELLQKKGCKPLSLAPNILRAETAALAFLAQLQMFLP
ncbi:MAG: 16S rRNA (uracil(1498)-N(3))-methyltransferase [Candidatus Margulisiibacteriota bacterium]